MSQDRDTCEPLAFWALLGSCYGSLESHGRFVAFPGLRDDETKRDERVWIGESEDVVPVALVESSERCKDEDGFLVLNRVGGGCDIVKVIMDNGRGFAWAIE